MRKQDHRLINRYFNAWFHIRDRIVYLPGGLILLYGFWLSLTA